MIAAFRALRPWTTYPIPKSHVLPTKTFDYFVFTLYLPIHLLLFFFHYFPHYSNNHAFTRAEETPDSSSQFNRYYS